MPLGYHWVSLAFTGCQLVSLGVTRCHLVLQCQCQWVILGLIGHHSESTGITGCQWILLDATGDHWVSLGFSRSQ